MAASSRALALGALAALALLLAALFLLQAGGRPGRTEVAEPDPEATSDRSAAPPAPLGPEGAVEGAEAARSERAPDLSSRRTAAVRGRVVMKAGAKPVPAALVKLRTGENEIDYPETVARLGGPEGMSRLRTEGLFDDRLREVGGWKPAFTARSNEDGAFSVALPPDFPQFRFEVEADFGRFSEETERWYALGSAELEGGATLRLDPAGKIEGTLVSTAGKPVAEGRVSAKFAESWGGRGVDADAAGRFSIGGLRPGRYSVAGLGAGFGAATREDLEVRAGEVVRTSLELPAEGFVAGRVVDEDGRGVPRAKVWARPQEGRISGYGDLRYGACLTDAEGNFRVGSLVPGKHAVNATRVGRVAGKGETVEVPSGLGVESLKLVLAGGKSLAGRVVDAAGGAIANAEVYARTDRNALRARGNPRPRSTTTQSTVSAADGSFRIGGLDEGPFLLDASLKGRGRAERREVPPGGEGIEIVLEAAATIAGIVRDAESGEPVLRFQVEATRFDPSRGPSWSEGGGSQPFATRDGAFALKERKAGTYEILVGARGYVSERVRGLEVKTGEAKEGIEVRLRRGSAIRGTVLEKVSTAPVEEASVWVERVERAEESDSDGEVFPPEPSRADGAFEVAGLTPGTWKVHARREGFVNGSSEPVRVGERDAVEGIAVPLSRGGGVDGFAVGADGTPYEGGQVSVSRSDGERSSGRLHSFGYFGGDEGRRIDATGYFRIDGLLPGTYVVEAEPAAKPGESWQERQAKVLRARTTVEEGQIARAEFVRLAGGCLVRGRVLRGKEGGVEGANVSLSFPGGEGTPAPASAIRFPRQAATSAGGAFEFPHVPPGEATIFAYSGQGGQVSTKVTVPDAPEHTVELRFPGGEVSGRVVSGADGAALPRVFVTARLAEEGEKGGAGRAFQAQTGEDGRYRIRDIPAGIYAVRSGPGAMWRGDDKTVGLATEERSGIEVREDAPAVVDLSLPVGGKALVAVRDAAGKARSGAQVEIRRAEGKPANDAQDWWAGTGNWGAPTGEDGTARIVGLPAGTYFAVARFGGCAASGSDEALVRLGQEAAFRVDLREGTKVRLRVLGPDEKTVKEAWCSFTDARGVVSHADWGEQRIAASEEKGLLLLRLQPGEYKIEAGAEGYRTQTVTVSVGAASPQDFVVRLEPEPKAADSGAR